MYERFAERQVEEALFVREKAGAPKDACLFVALVDRINQL